MKPAATHEETRYRAAASELMRALRSDRSQRWTARRLGFTSNVCSDWEHGRRYPTASETLRVAALLKHDLNAAFAPFAPAPPPRSEDGYSVAQWLHTLRGSTRNTELARRTGRTRSCVGRWLSGKSSPKLPEFLHLLEAITGRAAEWAAGLVAIERIPTLEATYRRASAARRVALALPWTEALLRVFETTGYQLGPPHDDAVVADILGIDEQTLTNALIALEEAEIVELNSDGRYVVKGSLVVDTRDSSIAVERLRQHWARVAFDSVRQNPEDWFAYNVVSVSENDCERIEQVLREAYREIRGIVSNSTPCERAALLTMHLTRW